MNEVRQRLLALHAQIEILATRYGRDPSTINVLAVSKTKPANAVSEAAKAGQRHFGENQLGDALSKIDAPELAEFALTWHFIGTIQSNKTRGIAERFDWVHSVDRLKIAERLSAQRPLDRDRLAVCLQVNIDDETNKSGVDPEGVIELADAVRALPNLSLRGLMAIPRPTTSLARQRHAFRTLRLILNRANDELGLAMDTLSMGMSGDLEAAIAEGATWVRVGTAIFGAREPA